MNNRLNKTSKKKSYNKFFDNRIEWMTVEDTAKYLGRSENAIYLLISKGVLTRYKLDRRVYLKRSEIDRQLESSALMGGGL